MEAPQDMWSWVGTIIGGVFGLIMSALATYGTWQAYMARINSRDGLKQSTEANDAVNHRHERGEGLPRAYDILLDLHVWKGRVDERLDSIEDTASRTHDTITRNTERLTRIEQACARKFGFEEE